MTHTCVGKLTIIGSDNGLSPDRRQAIIWTNVGILLIGPLWTNFSEILIGIRHFQSRKCIWKCRLRNGVHLSRPQCVKMPIVLRADWPWPSRSNLTVYLHRFCVIEKFVRRAKTESVELFHIPNGSAHMLIPMCSPTGLRHEPLSSLVVYLVRPAPVLGSSHSPYRSMSTWNF